MTTATSTHNGSQEDHLDLAAEGARLSAGGEEGLYDRFMELLPRVRTRIRSIDGERDAISAERQERIAAVNAEYAARLTDIDTERKRLNALLKALGEEPEISAPTPRAKGATKSVGIRSETLLTIIAAIEREGAGKFTALGIQEACKQTWSSPTLYNSFNYLREQEYIGKAGKEGNGNGRMLFRVLDPAVGERLKESLGAPAAEPKADEPAKPAKRVRAEVPSRSAIDRHVVAMKARGDDAEFTAIDIQEELGLASATGTRIVFRYLIHIGYLSEVGQDGFTGRMRYRIANADALTTPSEEN